MKNTDPWLFQRLVRLGFLSASLPIYVFSQKASEQVEQLNNNFDQKKLAEVGPYPHDGFAIEMSCKTKPPQLNDEKMRTLTVVFRFGSRFFHDKLKSGPLEATHLIMEVESLKGCTTIFPVMYTMGPSKVVLPANESATQEIIEKSNAVFQSEIMRNPVLACKYDVRLINREMMQKVDPLFYSRRASETAGFLTSACAALASPVAEKAAAQSVGRVRGERKGQERRVEIKWTHVDIDLDRTTTTGKGQEGEGRHGVALHPVRAHLRVTKHGVFPVRAHMRGDAAFGVRHRIARVRKGEVHHEFS
jgi:hypothetical protein